MIRRLLLFPGLFLSLVVPAWAHPGVGIVMDARGNVFYTDLKKVWKIAPHGKKTIAVPDVHTHELYLDAEDNLYGEHLWYEGEATNRWGHYLWRLSAAGKLEKTPPRQGFRTDHSFVRDRAGNMYWYSSGPPPAIVRRAPDGRTVRLAVNAGYRSVRWITAAPDGTVYFTDDGDLRRVAPDGSIATLARNLHERRRSLSQLHVWLVGRLLDRLRGVNDLHNLMGVWLDAQGRVYVAVNGGGLVKRVDPQGRVEVMARSPMPWAPTGGLVAPSGDLWLLEYSLTNAARVRRVGTDGNERVY